VAATNQLAALLDEHRSGAKAIFADLLHRLRNAPAETLDSALTHAVRDAVLALVAVLTTLGATRKDLDRSVIVHLGEHPDEKILTPLPRSGRLNAAQVLSEWGDSRQAYDGPDTVAALSGMCPVTAQSGKHRAVHLRWASNTRFRAAISTFADNSRHDGPWAAKAHTQARARGHDHPHAVRVLARSWVRMIHLCWIGGVPYDPARHGNAAALAAQPAARPPANRDPTTAVAADPRAVHRPARGLTLPRPGRGPRVQDRRRRPHRGAQRP